MTEDTLNPPMADADAQRRTELHAEGEKLGLKFDKRFSIKRMEDMIADKRARPRRRLSCHKQPKLVRACRNWPLSWPPCAVRMKR